MSMRKRIGHHGGTVIRETFWKTEFRSHHRHQTNDNAWTIPENIQVSLTQTWNPGESVSKMQLPGLLRLSTASLLAMTLLRLLKPPVQLLVDPRSWRKTISVSHPLPILIPCVL